MLIDFQSNDIKVIIDRGKLKDLAMFVAIVHGRTIETNVSGAVYDTDDLRFVLSRIGIFFAEHTSIGAVIYIDDYAWNVPVSKHEHETLYHLDMVTEIKKIK